MADNETTTCKYCKGTGFAPMGDKAAKPTKCGFCEDGQQPVRKSWVREDFDEWSELTKERDGYRADAEAERHRL